MAVTLVQRAMRMDLDVWSAAAARAAGDGTNLSTLLRAWLEDYASSGIVRWGTSPDRRAVRLTVTERDAVREALGGLDVAGIVVDAINKQRSSGS